MGETYARLEGYPEEVARAISEQFLPDAAGGTLPATVPGALLATAEKIDNVVAAIAVGEPPSGSKDPYGLRRAAMGMVAIAFKHAFEYDLRELVAFVYDQFHGFGGLAEREPVVSQATEFVLERLVRFLTDNDISRESVDAVLPTSAVFSDLRKRAASLDGFRASPSWDDLVTAFSRPSNLAKKLPLEAEGIPVDPGLFAEEAEKELFAAWQAARQEAQAGAARGDYYGAFSALAGLRPAVDRYFDDVLVMADDEALRLNRLRLLAEIASGVRSLALLDRLPG
jgi:glycyl-tRNA synthetase beta chain